MSSWPNDATRQNVSELPLVIDASALLALVLGERLSVTHADFENGILSTVNLTETLSKMVELGTTAEEAMNDIEALGLKLAITDFDQDVAMRAADLRADTKHLGLSLGDRACLATARSRGNSVLTADRLWNKLSGFTIVLAR
jgi:ribonuclease VapC